MPRRICILASFPTAVLPGFSGGKPADVLATWLPQIAQGLENERDFEVHWITLTKAVGSPQFVRQWNQVFHLLPRGKHSISILTAYRKERSRIGLLLDELKPDLIHAWGTEDVYGLVAIDRNETSILSIQGILQEICKVAPQSFLLRWQAHHEQRILAKISHLVVESDWGRAHLERLAPRSRIDVIEYGVNPLFLNSSRTPESKPVALYVGSLSASKGTDLLLRAFSDPRLSEKELWLVGDGPLRPKIGSCPPNVKVLGRLCPQKVKERMQRAWCLVHPTLVDTSPNCVKEARVVGLPVVTTHAGGQIDYVKHTQSGWIHEVGDIEGLIQGILFTTESKQISLNLGNYDQARCYQILDPNRTVNSLCELYRIQ